MKTDHTLELFREIPEHQQRKVQGGGLAAFLAAAAIGALVKEVVEDWDNFKNGLMGRPEEIPTP